MSIARLESRFRRAALFNFVMLLQMGCSADLKQHNLLIHSSSQALVIVTRKLIEFNMHEILFQYEKNIRKLGMPVENVLLHTYVHEIFS